MMGAIGSRFGLTQVSGMVLGALVAMAGGCAVPSSVPSPNGAYFMVPEDPPSEGAAKEQEKGPDKAQEKGIVIITLDGEADLKAPGADAWSPAKVGDKIVEGTEISTGFRSKVVLQLAGTYTISLKSLTQVRLDHVLFNQASVETAVRLDIGSMDGEVEKGEREVDFEVRSPVVTASVRGTRWTFQHTSDFGFRLDVTEGLVGLRAPTAGQANVGVSKGHRAGSPPGSALRPGGPIPPGIARTTELRNSERRVELQDTASQADLKSALASMVPQFAEFSLSGPGVATSVMSLQTLFSLPPERFNIPGTATFAICPKP